MNSSKPMANEQTSLYRTTRGLLIESGERFHVAPESDWDTLFNDENLAGLLDRLAPTLEETHPPDRGEILPPLEGQEVWAAGVTYYRSRDARMQEAREAGGGNFYDRVYVAERPELFMKATRHRVVGHGQPVRIRRDTSWSVPEPELALAVNRDGRIFGYTIGNDMSARDIEGENPLYLPQAKVYDQCCALGPGLLVTNEPLPTETVIRLEISRDGATAFKDETTLAAMKRTPEELVRFLFRDNSFPAGCFLLTGTGIVPPDDFSLEERDIVRISITGLGTLENHVIRSADRQI